MSLDKTELKYLITELKKVFATKKEFNNAFYNVVCNVGNDESSGKRRL